MRMGLHRGICLLTFVLSVSPVFGEEIVTGRVISVSCGDTLMLLDTDKVPHIIHLSGIDAPEKGQEYEQRSRINLSKLVYNRRVTATCRQMDESGRRTCTVKVGRLDVGHEQVQKGMAWWRRADIDEQPQSERVAYEQAEIHARLDRLGIWSSTDPVPPWEWPGRK